MVLAIDNADVEKQAKGLEEHTTLSEKEAYVFAYREAGSPHRIIAEEMDISESASQQYYSRAQRKASEAARTNAFLNEGKMPPFAADEHPTPAPDDPGDLTLDELQFELRAAAYWLDLDVETLYNGDMDLQQQKEDIEDALIEKLREEIQMVEEKYEESLMFRDLRAGGEKYKLTTNDRGRFILFGDEGVPEETILRHIEKGNIEICFDHR